jgi:ATP-dependent Clp protease ATP-binding subunit ClpA
MTPPPSLQDLINTVHQDARTSDALDQLISAAATVAQLEDTNDALLGHFVDRCRREGRSWSEISGALGVTKQAVHKRFAASIADKIIASVPSPTLERFTDRARKVLAAAIQKANADGQQQASSVHLLLGLFTQPEGVAAKALQQMNVSEAAVVAAAAGVVSAAPADASGPGAAADAETDTESGGQAPKRFTADGRRVLRNALAVALEHGHNYIGTEHLLLGLYREPDSPAAAALAAAGAQEAEVTARVTELLRGFRQPPTA